jgi:predicted nucleotidyltransferase
VTIGYSQVAAFCREHGIVRLSLFGSALHGRLHAGSDIDLLVEFDPDRVPGLLTMARLELELGEILGRPVDLRTPGEISSGFRDEVTARARRLFPVP